MAFTVSASQVNTSSGDPHQLTVVVLTGTSAAPLGAVLSRRSTGVGCSEAALTGLTNGSWVMGEVVDDLLSTAWAADAQTTIENNFLSTLRCVSFRPAAATSATPTTFGFTGSVAGDGAPLAFAEFLSSGTIARDSASPAAVTNTTTATLTTAAFTPTAFPCLLVAMVGFGSSVGGTTPASTVSDTSGSGVSWAKAAENATSGNGLASVWYAYLATAPAAAQPSASPARPGRVWRHRFKYRRLLAPLAVLTTSSTIDGTRPITGTVTATATSTKPAAAAPAVTANRAAAVSNAKPAAAAATVTASRVAAVTITKPAAASQAITAGRTAAATVTSAGGISGTRPITATAAAAVTITKPAAASQAITAGRVAQAASAKPVTATTLAATASRTAALTRTRNAAAALAVTAGRTAVATSAKAIAAARPVTANRAAAATDVPPGKNIDAIRPVTAGRAAAVTAARPAAASQPVTANRTAALTVAKPIAAALTVTASRTATEADTGSFTTGVLAGTAAPGSTVAGAVTGSQLTGTVAASATLTSEIDTMGGPG